MPRSGSARAESTGLFLVGIVGTLFAPSLGAWSVGSGDPIGVSLRGIGAASLFWVIRRGLSCEVGPCGGPYEGPAAYGGLLLFSAGTIVSLAMTPSAVRRHNRRVRDLTVVPAVQPRGGGVVLAGRF